MVLSLSVPVIAAAAGLALYGFGKDKVAEVGRILFFAGVLTALFHLRA